MIVAGLSLNVHTEFSRSQERGIPSLTIGNGLKSFRPLTREIVRELLSVLVHFIVHPISAPGLLFGWMGGVEGSLIRCNGYTATALMQICGIYVLGCGGHAARC